MGQQCGRPSLVEDTGSAASTKLGLLRDVWKENWHGRRVGSPKDLEAIIRREEKGSRKIRMSQTHTHTHTHTHTRRLFILLASSTHMPMVTLTWLPLLPVHLLMPFPGAPKAPFAIQTPICSPSPSPNPKERGIAFKTEDFKDSEMQSHVRGWGADVIVSEQVADPTSFKLSPLLCEVVPDSLGYS